MGWQGHLQIIVNDSTSANYASTNGTSADGAINDIFDYGATNTGVSYNCAANDGSSNVVPPKKGFLTLVISTNRHHGWADLDEHLKVYVSEDGS